MNTYEYDVNWAKRQAAPTLRRIDVIQSQIARLEAEAAHLERVGEDTYDDGDVLFFEIVFNEARGPFSYAALKAGGKWFVTGSSQVGSSLTWAQLVERFLAKASRMWVATGWGQVF